MHIELNLPEQQVGQWSIETFWQDGKKYHRLWKGDFLVMLNTPEIVDYYQEFFSLAKGTILINGLGLGMCCEYLLKKRGVEELIVVENEKGMVDLIGPYFSEDPRCTIVHADAFTYRPPAGKTFDFVWHDIWYQHFSKNLEDMDRLFEKYADIAKWQGAWARAECLEIKREEDEMDAYFKSFETMAID